MLSSIYQFSWYRTRRSHLPFVRKALKHSTKPCMKLIPTFHQSEVLHFLMKLIVRFLFGRRFRGNFFRGNVIAQFGRDRVC